jgi:hypothetical protein
MSGLVNDGHVHPFFTVKTSMNDTTKGQMTQQRAILQCYIELSEGIFELLNVFLLIIAHQCSVLVRICTRLQLIHHFKENIPTQNLVFLIKNGRSETPTWAAPHGSECQRRSNRRPATAPAGRPPSKSGENRRKASVSWSIRAFEGQFTENPWPLEQNNG